MDIRELLNEPEEMLRAAFGGLMKRVFTSMPVIVSKTSKDGHTVELKMSIKGQMIDSKGKTKQVEYPLLQDVPIHFAGGGGVTLTHPIAQDDEGLAVFLSRPQDAWHQSGGVQAPIDDRMNSLSDARYIPGGRSDPRKIKNVVTDAAHLRSDDGKHTIEQHPTKGVTTKSVDKNDQAENPFKDAKKFYQSAVQGDSGIEHRAQNDQTAHKHAITHDAGHVIDANNGKHSATVHPSAGAAISADNGQHAFQALSGIGAKIKSVIAHLIQAPNANLDAAGNLSVTGSVAAPLAAFGGIAGFLNSGGGAGQGIGAGAMANGAAATNVGPLGGDLSGTLPNPNVVGITHINNAHTLPVYASNAAAVAGGVALGSLYLHSDGTNAFLCVRT